MNDIYIVEIFQHDRWKLPLNVQSTQSDRERERERERLTVRRERDRKDEKMGEKNDTGETDGKGLQEEKMIKARCREKT